MTKPRGRRRDQRQKPGIEDLRYTDFERAAREAFEEIPEEYREGVDGLTVRREALSHPTLPDVYTLGHCLTEQHPSDYGGPDTTRSVIALYWGSFRELAEQGEDFDWEGELWETLTHEIRHHLESLAGDDALEDIDYAADEMFKRQDGRPFDPWYYQRGEALGAGVYLVEGAYHVEQEWEAGAFGAAAAVEFDWRGVRYRIPRPQRLGDAHFVLIRGEDFTEESLELVLARRRGWWEGLLGVLTRSARPEVTESEATAERISGP